MDPDWHTEAAAVESEHAAAKAAHRAAYLRVMPEPIVRGKPAKVITREDLEAFMRAAERLRAVEARREAFAAERRRAGAKDRIPAYR